MNPLHKFLMVYLAGPLEPRQSPCRHKTIGNKGEGAAHLSTFSFFMATPTMSPSSISSAGAPPHGVVSLKGGKGMEDMARHDGFADVIGARLKRSSMCSAFGEWLSRKADYQGFIQLTTLQACFGMYSKMLCSCPFVRLPRRS